MCWLLNMTLDLYVGFEQEPKGLEDFMKKQGYTRIERHKDTHGGYLTFERNDNPWPCVFYSPHAQKAEDPDELPNWRRAGFRVVSEANINFPNDSSSLEASRLARELVNKFNGIFCDPQFIDIGRRGYRGVFCDSEDLADGDGEYLTKKDM